MEGRKLIQSGVSSLMISLPSRWIKQNNLSKGDTVFLDSIKNQIVISPQPSKKEGVSYTINLNNETKKYIEQLLYAGFLSTKKVLTVKNINKTTYYNILKIAKRLPYLKIEHNIDNELKLVFIADVSSLNLKEELKKTVFLFDNFFSLLLEKNNPNSLEYLTEAYEQITSQILLLMKTIKIVFLNYDKVEIIRFKQQIDSYYFLLKNCKEFIRHGKQGSMLTGISKELIIKVRDFLKKINYFISNEKMLDILELHDSLVKEKEKLFHLILEERNSKKVRRYLLVNNIYETLLNTAYTFINNNEKLYLSTR